MIIYSTNILAVPLLIMVWLIDLYLLLIGARWIVAHTPCEWATRVLPGLQNVTDGIPTLLHRRVFVRCCGVDAPWLAWFCVLAGALVGRHLLLWVILTGLR
jgi:hypothetical protein